MQDRTRIAVCRFSFLLLCAVPTLLTGGFIVFHWLTIRSPAAKDEWERELSQRLGVAVTIEALSYPQPSVAELTGVRLADPETGEPLAESRRVEIEPLAKRWQVTLVEPIVRREALPALAERLHERLLTGAVNAPPLSLAATQLTIQADEGAVSLASLSSDYLSAATGPVWNVRCALPQQPQPIDLTISRNRQVSPPATQFEWSCPAPLPAHLLHDLFPGTSALGGEATFSGSGRLTVARSQVRGEVSGQLTGIDLTTAVSQRFPHLLSGRATLMLDTATIEEGCLSHVRGTLVVAEGGRIGRSLLSAAEEHLDLQVDLPPEEVDTVHYQRLALRFELTGDDLRLTGQADEDHAGAMIRQSSGPLVWALPDHRAPVVALARTLLPDSQLQVPAAMQTASLLKLLPLRNAEMPLTARRTGHTPTRLGPASPADRSAGPIREGSLR